MAHRVCEDCGASMQPFVRRTRREDGSLVCRACLPEERGGRRGGGRPEATPHGYRSPHHWESAKQPETWEPEPQRELPDRFEPLFEGRRRKVAHDSGDGETLYHCPFCGAGQVVGNSDGTAQCGFCNTTFTVQVQPNQPEMPQTIDGQPYDIPDMPGESRGGDSGLPPPPVEEETPVPIEEEAKQPPQQPPQFATSSGKRLSEGDYIAHLALRHTRNREATLRAIRAQRGD